MDPTDDRLELFFSQSLDGFFFMMLDEPIAWNDRADKERAARLRARSPSRDQGQRRDAEAVRRGPRRASSASRRGGCSRTTWTTAGGSGASSSIAAGCTSRPKSAASMAIRSSSKATTSVSTMPSGRITGHFGIQRDVTERPARGRAARARARDAASPCGPRSSAISEHRTRAILSALPDLRFPDRRGRPLPGDPQRREPSSSHGPPTI